MREGGKYRGPDFRFWEVQIEKRACANILKRLVSHLPIIDVAAIPALWMRGISAVFAAGTGWNLSQGRILDGPQPLARLLRTGRRSDRRSPRGIGPSDGQCPGQ